MSLLPSQWYRATSLAGENERPPFRGDVGGARVEKGADAERRFEEGWRADG